LAVKVPAILDGATAGDQPGRTMIATGNAAASAALRTM
jgi:hypothetical protein